jgi:large subunit ribosomal protein L35
MSNAAKGFFVVAIQDAVTSYYYRKGKEMAKMKLKTSRSAAKRFKVTGSGKVVRRKGWKGHLLSGKNATRKRRLTGAVEVDKDNVKNIQRMLPYRNR